MLLELEILQVLDVFNQTVVLKYHLYYIVTGYRVKAIFLEIRGSKLVRAASR